MAGDLSLGAGVTLTGTVAVPGRAVIDGTLEGTLTAREVLVGPAGKVSGTLEADTVELQGEGPATLTARVSLVVRSTGRVSGTVRYGRLEVEPGGQLQGDLAPLVNAATITLAPTPAAAGGSGGGSGGSAGGKKR